jgi:hypothetical protein
MTVDAFIRKKNLILWKTHPNPGLLKQPFPSPLIQMGEQQFPVDHKYEVYANGDKTILLVKNLTAGVFCIHHFDMVHAHSDWFSMESEFSPGAPY